MRFSELRVVTLFLVGVFATAMCPTQVWFGVPAKAAAQDGMGASQAKAAKAVSGDPFGDSEKSAVRNARPKSAKSNDRTKTADNSKSKMAIASSLSDSTMADDKIREKLSAPCDLDFDESTWTEIREFLESGLRVNIILTTSASDDALTEDETFTARLSGITYASALRIMLAPKNATYVIDGGAIKIISLDEAYDEQWFSRRMIDVSETLQLIRVAEQDRIGKPKPGSPKTERRLQPRGGGSGMSGGGVFAIQMTGDDSTEQAEPAVEAKEIKKLADAILEAVLHSQPKVELVPTLVTAESILIDAIAETNPNVGKNGCVGGGDDCITCVSGILIINGPEEVNERVESFIEDLTFNMKAAAEKRR